MSEKSTLGLAGKSPEDVINLFEKLSGRKVTPEEEQKIRDRMNADGKAERDSG